MWIIVTRTPKPDAAYWPGRRHLAVVDALAWPTFWVALVAIAPFSAGVIGIIVVAIALVAAVLRVQRAILSNERYWFTTWRWGAPLFAIVVAGYVMKVVA
jgi:small-conductance mechanosensitive channel